MQIHIVEAIGLALLESAKEVEVEETLPLNVASYTQWHSAQVPFTTCHQLPFKVEPDELSFTALPGILISHDFCVGHVRIPQI